MVNYARNRGEICKYLDKYQISFNSLIVFYTLLITICLGGNFLPWQTPQMTTPNLTVAKIDIFLNCINTSCSDSVLP